MPTIVYHLSENSKNGERLCIISTDKYNVENFIQTQIPIICAMKNAECFLAEEHIVETGLSYAAFEFYPGFSQDIMLEIITRYNQHYCKYHTIPEVLLTNPTSEQLKLLTQKFDGFEGA